MKDDGPDAAARRRGWVSHIAEWVGVTVILAVLVVAFMALAHMGTAWLVAQGAPINEDFVVGLLTGVFLAFVSGVLSR